MINLIRGKGNKLDKDWLEGISDFTILFKNNKAAFSIDNISIHLLNKIIEEEKEYDLYFTKFDEKILYLMNRYDAKLKKNGELKKIEIKDIDIFNLRDFEDEEKIEWLFNNINTTDNFKLLNEVVNKKTLSIDALIKKVVIENE